MILKVCKNPSIIESLGTQPKLRLLMGKDVAEILQVNIRTVWRFVERGRLRKIRLSSGVVRFRMEDVLRLCSIEGGEEE